MDWRRYVRSHLPPLEVSAEREAEIVEELAAQLEATYTGARSAGATEAAARALADAEVPDWNGLAWTLARIERPVQAMPAPGNPNGGFMTGLAQDLRYARRGLMRSPVFTVVTIATLAIGLGIGTVAFSIIDTVLRRPLPFASPERLMLLHASVPPDGRETVEITYPDGQDLAKETSVFEGLSLVMLYAGTTTTLDPPERIMGTSCRRPRFRCSVSSRSSAAPSRQRKASPGAIASSFSDSASGSASAAGPTSSARR